MPAISQHFSPRQLLTPTPKLAPGPLKHPYWPAPSLPAVAEMTGNDWEIDFSSFPLARHSGESRNPKWPELGNPVVPAKAGTSNLVSLALALVQARENH